MQPTTNIMMITIKIIITQTIAITAPLDSESESEPPKVYRKHLIYTIYHYIYCDVKHIATYIVASYIAVYI